MHPKRPLLGNHIMPKHPNNHDMHTGNINITLRIITTPDDKSTEAKDSPQNLSHD